MIEKSSIIPKRVCPMIAGDVVNVWKRPSSSLLKIALGDYMKLCDEKPLYSL